MASERPECNIVTTAGDGGFKGSCTIDEQEGFYGQAPVPDMDKRAGQVPATAGDRFSSNIFADK